MDVQVVLAKGNKETEIRREFWVEVKPGKKDTHPTFSTAEVRTEGRTRWLLKREAVKFDSRVFNFAASTVVNRTLSAVVFLAQRDTDSTIATLRLDHTPSLRLASQILDGQAPPKPALEPTWAYFVALMNKVRWRPEAL